MFTKRTGGGDAKQCFALNTLYLANLSYPLFSDMFVWDLEEAI